MLIVCSILKCNSIAPIPIGTERKRIMIINNECIRDIMFTIEGESSFKCPCRMIGILKKYPNLAVYGDDMLEYHLRYLKMKELIFNPSNNDAYGYDLTPAGHEFIENIRDDNNWKKIKGISSNIGFASLKVISAISEGVATAAINKQLGFSE